MSSAADGVELRVGRETVHLSSADARELVAELGEALARERVFVKTLGRRRADGRYVVERRGAASAGQRKVFDSFGAVTELIAALPETFTAADVGRRGLTGSRRHALVWHAVEHPAFDCELASKQPLTARKGPDAPRKGSDAGRGPAEPSADA